MWLPSTIYTIIILHISNELVHGLFHGLLFFSLDAVRGSLRYLDIKNNFLDGSKLLDMFFDEGRYQTFPNMTKLDLSNNSLTTVPVNLVQHMPLLETFYLHENPNMLIRPDLNGLEKLTGMFFELLCLATCRGTIKNIYLTSILHIY